MSNVARGPALGLTIPPSLLLQADHVIEGASINVGLYLSPPPASSSSAGSALVFPVRRLAPDGLEAGKQVIARGYEGYVAKDAASAYEGGATRRWVKVKQKDWTVEEDGWRRREIAGGGRLRAGLGANRGAVTLHDITVVEQLVDVLEEEVCRDGPPLCHGALGLQGHRVSAEGLMAVYDPGQ